MGSHSMSIWYIEISCSTTVDPCRLVVNIPGLASTIWMPFVLSRCVSTQFNTIPAHFTLSSTRDKDFLVNSSKLNTISRVALLDLHYPTSKLTKLGSRPGLYASCMLWGQVCGSLNTNNWAESFCSTFYYYFHLLSSN